MGGLTKGCGVVIGVEMEGGDGNGGEGCSSSERFGIGGRRVGCRVEEGGGHY